MKKKEYKKRIIDSKIDMHLRAFGAIAVEGPKWCGKTWSSENAAASEFKLGNPEGNFQNSRLAETNLALILDGEQPRLIDEWQEVPQIWDAIRAKTDENRKKGCYILTGSSTPKRKGIMHSGAGRISRIRMGTMSLFESGYSSGRISLEDICRNKAEDTSTGEVKIEAICDLIIRGGWPENIGLPLEYAALLPSQYIEAIVKDDVSRLDEKKRDYEKMMRLLRSLARNESTTASKAILKRDIADVEAEILDENTISDYLDVFNRLFLIDNQPPFSPSVRSSTRVKQREKRHFCDQSIACSLMGITKPEMLIGDLETTGFLFESLVEHDLKIYAESFNARLFHYQDYKNKEVDAVVELDNGDWCAFEIKLGANQIDMAANNLLDIAKSFNEDPKGKPPTALCVICGLTNAAYRRPDGVYVVPITALKP